MWEYEKVKDSEVIVDLSDKNVKKNMVLGTIYKAVSMILSYLYVPIVLMCLGEVKYGVWTTILNVVSWISYFDIGIGNGLRNKLAENFGENNEKEKCRSYVSSAYIILSGMIGAVTLLALIISSFVDWKAVFNAKSLNDNVSFVMQISIAFMALSFVLSICKSIYYALQKNSIVGLMGIVQQILMILGVCVLTRRGADSLVLVALLYGFANVAVELFFTFYLYKISNVFIPRVKYLNKYEAKDTMNLGVLFFIVQISALILFTTDNLIIAHFIGPAEVTSYSLVNKLFSAGTAMFAMLVAPFWSRATTAKSQNDFSIIKKSIVRMKKIWIVGIAGSLILAIVFRPIARIWLQKDLNYSDGLIPLMAIYAIVFMWNCIYSQIANGLSLMRVLIPTAITQGIVNIPLSLFFMLSCNMGVVGVLLGTLLSMVISAVIVPIYVHKYLNEMEKNSADK